MRPIAVYYHCRLTSPLIQTGFACKVVAEQMLALRSSGLADACDELHIGINGDEKDGELARMFAPAKAKITTHGPQVASEIPTMAMLREWLPGHEEWRVLYFHSKGICHPGEMLYTHWRRCMECAVVKNWQRCIADLENGIEACGCHWMSPEVFGPAVKSPYFGGTFFWATARFLLTLPALPAPTWANRFEAENWIGRGPRRPIVRDYHKGWPGSGCALRT